ncbi:MAG: hypothetical protein LBG89_01565 [Rickettsiales bacterium]|jgi:hypothetical protein|nr:hypothetical protein [Rickettsiales bacterium]
MTRGILVYPGLGKSTLCAANPKFEDFETRIFKDMNLKEFIGRDDYPNFRGTPLGPMNPDFPDNMIEYARRELAAGRILLTVPKKDTYDACRMLGIDDYVFVMPDRERLAQLEQDYIARGDGAKYIADNLAKRYDETLEYAKANGKKVVFLKPGEYLGDIVENLI